MSPSVVRDMLFVKQLERRLGRSLSEDELNHDEELELRFPDGHREFIVIPKLIFPDDLLSAPELGVILELQNENEETLQYSNAS